MQKYAFWNNKGGTGKTSLSFQIACAYANKYPDKKILVIDVCPQANLSELFLGGLVNQGSAKLLEIQGETIRATIGGYFQSRFDVPYARPTNINPRQFIKKPSNYNAFIPTNIDLFAGDPILELQSNAVSTLANSQIPGVNTWIAIIDWLSDFIDSLDSSYDTIFIDTNPSFSIYTQIALSSCESIILPVMADDSSRRAVQNVFSLVYGIKLPSEIYTKFAFASKLKEVNRDLPKIKLILKNRITQYMGSASAYRTVLEAIDNDIAQLMELNPEMFTFNSIDNGIAEMRDFQTTGVVAHARGCPFFNLKSGNLTILGQRVQIKEEYRQNCIDNIAEIVDKI